MPFIDWNNNGKIDPTDIGIGIALDSESENSTHDDNEDPLQPKRKRKPNHGCLTTVLIFVCGIVFLVLVVVII